MERALHLTQPQQPEKVPHQLGARRGLPPCDANIAAAFLAARVLQVEPAVRSLWAAPARRSTVLVVHPLGGPEEPPPPPPPQCLAHGGAAA